MRTTPRKSQTPIRFRNISPTRTIVEKPKAKIFSSTGKSRRRQITLTIRSDPVVKKIQILKKVSTKVTKLTQTKSGSSTRKVISSVVSHKSSDNNKETSSKNSQKRGLRLKKPFPIKLLPQKAATSRKVASPTRRSARHKTTSKKSIDNLRPTCRKSTDRSTNSKSAESRRPADSKSTGEKVASISRRSRMSDTDDHEMRLEIDQPQETVEISTNETAHHPTSPATPSSQKKLKGSMSIKFKSWNYDDKQPKPSQLGLQTSAGAFESSEEEEEEEENQNVETEKVIVSQNNQTLQKCQNCLLYVPVDSFDQHKSKECEALHVESGREYICSECLACYSSQKFLVRHKRECPKKNQNYTLKHSRYPKSVSQAELDGMYSVVWKCHCKKNFTSAEDLGKHRETCVSAQQYTATCPICNMRMMGGSRTLHYHMTQNHADLFMPEEKTSSGMLGSLEGTSAVQVITTQTTNIGDLVKKLSKEHTGASIRVVNVNQKPQQTPHAQLSPAPVQKVPTPQDHRRLAAAQRPLEVYPKLLREAAPKAPQAAIPGPQRTPASTEKLTKLVQQAVATIVQEKAASAPSDPRKEKKQQKPG